MTIAIDTALIDSFTGAAFGLPIAHENSDYTPVAGTAYAEIKVFHSGTYPAALKDWDRQIGIFQVILRYPTGSGAFAAKTQADAIESHFKLYSEHVHLTQAVQMVEGRTRPVAAIEDSWFKIVLRLPWRAFTPR